MSLPLLYLCRHGQTDWNAEGRLQGQEDIALNDLGRAQAKRNGRYLRNVLGAEASRFRFVSSPMNRARETMWIIRREMKLEPDAFEIDPRLIELNFGDWQGHTMAEVKAREPEKVKERKADKWNFAPPGAAAESYAMLAGRVKPVFEELDRPTLVTAHGGVTRSVLYLYGGIGEHEASHCGIRQDRVLHNRDGALMWG